MTEVELTDRIALARAAMRGGDPDLYREETGSVIAAVRRALFMAVRRRGLHIVTDSYRKP